LSQVRKSNVILVRIKKDIMCLENCKMWYGIRFCLGRIGKV